MTQEAKADYRLLMNIKKLDNSQIDNVLCKIFLPKQILDPIYLLFYPTPEQCLDLDNIFEFSIEGILNDNRGRVEATKVYRKRKITNHVGSPFQETVLTGEPMDLKIIKPLNDNYKNITSDSNDIIYFYLTPNIFLCPFKHIGRGVDEIKIENLDKFEFRLANDTSLVFNNHYNYVDNEEGDDVIVTKLVAECTTNLQSQRVEDILNYLDDFLAIVSFVTKQGCICLGWETVDLKKCTRTKFYRRNLTIPIQKNNHSLDQILVQNNLKYFMEIAYKKFQQVEPKMLIRHALHSTISARNETTLESSFISLYSALETLVLDFRRQNELEFVLSRNDWNKFYKQIKTWMEKDSLLSNKEQERGLIKQKLVELNRISFKTAFEKLIESFELDLTDLWNITGKTSLTEIRNKIVHGDTFDSGQWDSISVALNHLTWIVERVILSVLGCPISESRVSKQFLNEYRNLYHNWESARQLLAHPTETIIPLINDAPQDEV